MYAGGAALPLQLLLLGLAGALCPGFFLHECNPAPGAHPFGWAGLDAPISEPVTLA
jgi:hypothetical protein